MKKMKKREPNLTSFCTIKKITRDFHPRGKKEVSLLRDLST